MKQSVSKSVSNTKHLPNSRLTLILLLAPTLATSYALQGPSKSPQKKSPTPPTHATRLPQLGDEVPTALLKQSSTKPCDTGEDRHEPCATLTIHHDRATDRITIAWDATTRHITYLYSVTLVTDDDIRAGDVLAIDSAVPVTPFPIATVPHRFVSSEWCDTVADLSGDADWCAIMIPTRPRSGKVLGFVQSIYLYLDDIDTGPMRSISVSPSRHLSRPVSR
jgi:hypothetical protein